MTNNLFYVCIRKSRTRKVKKIKNRTKTKNGKSTSIKVLLKKIIQKQAILFHYKSPIIYTMHVVANFHIYYLHNEL